MFCSVAELSPEAGEGMIVAVDVAQVIPSELTTAYSAPLAYDTAQNTVPFHTISVQYADIDSVCCVHVTPSGLVADVLRVPLPVAGTAQNIVPFHAMASQSSNGIVLCCVHVIPSGLVATLLE
jgi:hypothetical protein